MRRYADKVLSASTGMPVVGATVAVYLAGTKTLATIYQTNDVNGPVLANPFGATGEFAFYPPNGEYDIVVMRGGRSTTLPNVGIYDPTTYQGPTGPAGPPGNVAATLDQLKAAPTTNRTMIAAYDGSGSTMTWTLGNVAAQAAERPQDYVQANGIPLTTGAWVRQQADGIIYSRTSSSTRRSAKEKLDDAASILDFIPVSQHAAIKAGTSTYIANDDFAAAQVQSKRIIMPSGKIMLDVSQGPGVEITTGLNLIGDGRNRTILVAAPGGGTIEQLAAYSRGSIIGRRFNPNGVNERVNDVLLSGFAVVMNHPTATVTSDAIQIGIDLRNVTRSTIERVHAGNYSPLGGPYEKPDQARPFVVQGYGIVLGNVSAGSAAYSGGEVNRLRSSAIWGAYKCVVLDDAMLSGPSASYAFIVEGCDIQVGHHLLVQESRFNTGMVWRDNTLQSVSKRSGDTSPSYVMRVEGYNNRVYPGYVEAGSGADYLLYMGSVATRNEVDLGYYSALAGGAITDEGVANAIYMSESTATNGGVNGEGRELVLYDRAVKNPWVKFHVSAGAPVIDDGQGLTVTRNGTGDYQIVVTRPFRTADYPIAVTLGTANGEPTSHSVRGVSAAGSFRLVTYVGGAQADPDYLWIKCG